MLWMILGVLDVFLKVMLGDDYCVWWRFFGGLEKFFKYDVVVSV